MQVSVGGKRKYIPDTWNDLIFDQWCRLNELKKPDTDEEKLDYYRSVCEIFLEEDLQKAKMSDLTEVFNHLLQFTKNPEPTEIEAKYIRLGNCLYKFSQETLNSATKPMNNAVFSEFEEANAVMNILSKMNEPKYLIYLVAIFYRPVKNVIFNRECIDFDPNGYEERADLFRYALTMDEVWACYFFLQNQLSTSAKDTITYLKRETEKRVS